MRNRVMNNRIIKIGIVGAGWIVEKAHIPALKNIEGAEVTAVFDIVQTKADDICKKFGIDQGYCDYEAFLRSGIEAIIIATPNHTHGEYSIRALAQGIHVLCEKPVALCVSEVQQAIKVASENNSVYLPGFVNRFRYDIQKLNEMIKGNQIGKVIGVDAGWIRKSGMPRPGSWFTNKQYSGGGVLNDLGSHVLDVAYMLTNSDADVKELRATAGYSKVDDNVEATWISANKKEDLPIDVEHTVNGQIKLEDESTINFHVTWCAPVLGDYTYFNIKGSKGSAMLSTLFGFSKERLFEKDTLSITDLAGNKEEIVFKESENRQEQAFVKLLRYFIKTINNQEKCVLSSKDAMRNVEVIESLYKYLAKSVDKEE